MDQGVGGAIWQKVGKRSMTDLRLSFKPSRSSTDRAAAKVVREYYLQNRGKVLAARSQSSSVAIPWKDDAPGGGVECTWVRIVDRCRTFVNPLWGIYCDFNRSLTTNRDISVRQICAKGNFADYQAAAAGLCVAHARRANSSIATLVERYDAVSLQLGVEVPESILGVIKQSTRLDAVIESYVRVILGAEIDRRLWIQSLIDYSFCPEVYANLPGSWLQERSLERLFEVEHALESGEALRVSDLQSTFGGSLPGS